MDRIFLNAVIIEDEKKSLDLLNDLIGANDGICVSGYTSNPEEALELIMKFKPDIVFLDISMPGKNGFEILDQLTVSEAIHPFIVFTTAYDEYAVKAFEYAAFDYLLKPIDPDRLEDTIKRCLAMKSAGTMQKTEVLRDVLKKLIYRSVSGIVIIDPAEVVYIEATGNYSDFRLTDGRKETITMSLGKIEEQLDPEVFFRSGRTFIINLNYLVKINSKKRECILHCNGLDFKCSISHDKIKILLDRLRNGLTI